MKTTTTILLLIAVGLLSFIAFSNPVKEQVNQMLGGTSPYNSTYTPSTGTAAQLLKTGFGTLANVVITGAGAGTIDIYNASTTNALIRTITATTSLPTVAHFPASATAGTYEFNTGFNDGLLVVFTGTIGTSTITWD